MDNESMKENEAWRTGSKAMDLKARFVEEFAKLDDDVKEDLLLVGSKLETQEEKEKFAGELAAALGWKVIAGGVVDRQGRELWGLEDMIFVESEQ